MKILNNIGATSVSEQTWYRFHGNHGEFFLAENHCSYLTFLLSPIYFFVW